MDAKKRSTRSLAGLFAGWVASEPDCALLCQNQLVVPRNPQAVQLLTVTYCYLLAVSEKVLRINDGHRFSGPVGAPISIGLSCILLR